MCRFLKDASLSYNFVLEENNDQLLNTQAKSNLLENTNNADKV